MSFLDRPKLEAAFQGKRIGRPLFLLERTSSTMDVARERMSEPGALVVAGAQDQGRGSRGRLWESPPGDDLYLSFVTGPLEPQASPGVLTLAIGLGVAEAAEALTGTRAEVKWPNDVLLGGKKIAGILVESSGDLSSGVVVGIGMNVNRERFSPELEENASSLALAKGEAIPREDALIRLLDDVEHWLERYARMGPAPVVDALAARLALRGSEVRVGETVGVLEGIASDGALQIRKGSELVRVLAGRVEPAR